MIAWRLWGYHEGRLRSLSRSVIWEPGRAAEATCEICTNPPGKDCQCGIYGAHDKAHLRRMPRLTGFDTFVLGRVHLWGRVIPGEFTYRARYGYPRDLVLISQPHRSIIETLDGLAAYGVTVEVKRWGEAWG